MIFVCPPDTKNLNSVYSQVSGSPFFWAYLGQSMPDANRTKHRFQEKGTAVDTNGGFHRAANTLRGPFLQYLYDIGERLDSLSWWTSSTSCRNGVTSKSFQEICYLKAALELLKKWDGPGNLVLVLGKSALPSLAQNLDPVKRKETTIVGLPRPPFLPTVSGAFKMVVHRAFFIIRESFRIIRSRKQIDRPILNNRPTTIIFCWATKDNIRQQSDFYKSFYGDLAEELENRGHQIAFVPMIWKELNYSDAIVSLSQGPRPVLVPHRYLSWMDLLRIAFSSAGKPPIPAFLPLFEGINLQVVLDADRRGHWISNAAADALVTKYIIQKWADLGFSIDRFIYLFENQPYERALCWQARQSFPQAALVGYQHGRAPLMAINMYQATGGEKATPQPDWVVTVGRHTARLLARDGTSPGRVVAGGALQMGDFFRLRNQRGTATQRPECPTVLVGISSRLEEAAELVDAAISLFSSDEGIKVILKCHPVMPFEDFAFLISQPLPPHIEISSEPIQELMLRSSVMIYTSSVTCVQALALGVPTVHLRSQFDVNMDPLELVLGSQAKALDIVELQEKVRWMLNNREEYVTQSQDQWDLIVNDMYGPVTEDTYNAFLDPENNIAAIQSSETSV